MTATMKPAKLHGGQWLLWTAFAAVLVLAPLVFNKGASLSILSQMGTLMIFGLSYNMLLGQGGMLSFGHAVYSGLGAFFAIHAMNLASAGKVWMPVSMIPLVGGLAGMFFGILFGYVTTKKSGITFSMITLGIVELVYSCSLMFPGFFGGEGGISTNRVYGESFLGLSFGPQIQVYYLIAFWLFISTVGMFAFTQTPLGRIINAVRDNPERVEFIGYDTQWARYLTLVLSGFFAGIAGGLSAVSFEIVTAENVSAHASGAILLFTFIGGAGHFAGPIIGSIVGVFLTVMLSDFTKAWQLYLGLFFIAIVMYAPGGILSVVMLQLRVLAYRKFSKVAAPMSVLLLSGLTALTGIIIVIEMLYHLTLDAANGTVVKVFGISTDAALAAPWLAGGALILFGGGIFLGVRPWFMRRWGAVHAEIVEEAMRRAEA
ncbi:branched-chain amino acid ABC transporter permease [Noviherbaspirillum denitrificans]